MRELNPRAACAVAAFILLLGQWQPLVLFSFSPEPWIMALSEAAAGRYRFGTDVVFTGGPLNDLYTRFFNPATFVRVLAAAYLIFAVQAAALTTLILRSPSPLFGPLLLVALYFWLARDVQLMMTPLLVALVALGRPSGRWLMALTILGAAASAIASLAKFSVAPLSVGLFLLVDLDRLRLRQLPLTTVSYGIALYLSFFLSASAGSDFSSYVSGSLATSSGYSGAMSIAGPWQEFVLYAVLVSASVLAYAMIERRTGSAYGWDEAGQALAIAFFLWVTFKIGFVRHDLHVLTAFSAVALAVPLYGLARRPQIAVGRAAGVALAAVAVLAGFFSHLRLAYDPSTRYELTMSLGSAALAGPREIWRSVGLLADPGTWLVEHLKTRRTYLASLAAASPIDDIDGTIDSVPSLQSGLIAAGLNYRPRPTIEEYTSYAPALIRRNRAFFAGTDGPDLVLFEPAAIDGRHPAFAEGASWPIFLSQFAPRLMAGEGVLLHRRPNPLGDILSPATIGRARMNAPLPVDFSGDPVFLSIDVRPTLFGRLADLVFKPPFLYLGVTPVGQPEQVYRLIPGIAREGFVASPLIRTAWQYILLAEGGAAERISPVQSIRVFSGVGGDLSYRQQIAYSVRRIDRARLAAGRDWPLSPEDAVALERARGFEQLVRQAGGPVPGFRVISGGLDAHAPRRFAVDTAGADRLTVGFGLRRRSWDESNGVCFRVLAGDAGKTLWERCLDPLQNIEDRPARRETLPLPVGTQRVVLETNCRGDCHWDWSYWNEITLER